MYNRNGRQIPVVATRELTLTEDRDPLPEPLLVCPMVVLLNLQGKTCSLFMSFTSKISSRTWRKLHGYEKGRSIGGAQSNGKQRYVSVFMRGNMNRQ
jgi:hypothetical protein